MSRRAVKRARRKLTSRIEVFDKMEPVDKISQTRPGSMNPHKGGGDGRKAHVKKKLRRK